MKCRGKLFGGLLAAFIVMATSSITAFADDYSFDITKSKPTYGGGQAFTAYTRLDNEKRDKYKFNPMWITEDSTVEIDYTCDEEYDTTPLFFVLQSWKGDKVAAQEDKWIQVTPTTLTDTHATWTYDTLVETYGSSNFSDVYALVIEDNNVGITMTSFTITNVSVPKDEIANLVDGVIYRDGEIVIVSDEDTAAEDDTSTDTAETAVVSNEDTTAESEEVSSGDTSEDGTALETDVALYDEVTTTTASSTKSDSSESTEMTSKSLSTTLIIVCVALGIVLVGVIAFIIIKTIRNRNRGWH
jgi:hypothetical protein